MGSLKHNFKKAVRSALSSAPVKSVLFAPVVKKYLDHAPLVRRLYRVWDRGHPFDKQYGIDTIGFLAANEITADKDLSSRIVCYAGSQPSIVRKALGALGRIEDYTLLDLGCGKGRATVVASEFPFRRVVGVELSPALAASARANAASIAKRFPTRPLITIAEGNVVDFVLPKGKIAIFAYHPFGAEILEQVVKKLEAALNGETPHIFFVYDNPVHAEVLDASPAFKRFYAQDIPYDESEIGYGVFTFDAVVIWQSVRSAIPTPFQAFDQPVQVVNGKAELAG